jgi:hypothetical protein
MNKFCCIDCNYSTNRKDNYVKHCKTIKHMNEIIKIKKEDNKEDNLCCNICNKVYKYNTAFIKHKKICNNTTEQDDKDTELKELVNALNEQIKNQQIQIQKLLDKTEINGSFNTINNIQNNIQLLSYNKSDLSHLTDKDYKNCIKHVNLCVLKLIEKIHFNPSKPENMNIYISNINNKYIMVYDGNNWQLKNRQNELDRLYEEKEMM